MKKILTIWLFIAAGFIFADDSYNVRLVGRIAYDYCSDVWGYETPDGHEFAIVGRLYGTSIVDISTNPASPVETGFIPGYSSIWRDMKVHDHYAYVINESGGGMDIIDLSDPWNPVDTGNYTGFSTAHNIFIDEGYAYIVGSDLGEGGMRILDLSDPENPEDVGGWEVAYIHDLYVKNNIAYVASIEAEKVFILDVTDKANIQQLAVVWNIPHAHATWVSEDGQTLFVASEMQNGYIRIFDISDLSNINQISSFVVNPGDNQSVHNVFVRDGYMYLSYYVHGTRIVDVSDPANPFEVGYYDPYEPSTGLYEGNWGTYPFSSSGLIFSTDMAGAGLSVLEFPMLADFQHTPPGDSEDLVSPIHVTTVVTEGPTSSLDYTTLAAISGMNGIFTQYTSMYPTGNPDEYAADMPNTGVEGEFSYFFQIFEAGGEMATQPYGAPVAYYSFHLGADYIPPELLYVSHAENLGFINATGSFNVTATATDNIGIATMSLYYSINNQGWVEQEMTFLSDIDGEITYNTLLQWENLQIPSQIRYYVRCWDSSSQINSVVSPEYQINVGGYELVDDFENGLSKWVTDGDWGVSAWGVNQSHAAHDSPEGPYAPNSNTSIVIAQPFDLTPYSSAELRFFKAVFTVPNQDFCYVKISTDGENWETLATYSGWQTWMEQEIIDISNWTGPGNDQVWLRFQVVTDGLNNADGFHVDNLEIFADVAPPFLPGDVNADGILDILDVVTMVSIIMEVTEPTDYQLRAGDLNEDGVLDVLDVVMAVNIITGN